MPSASRKTPAKAKQTPTGAFDYEGALEEICARIEDGETMVAIAKSKGVDKSRLTRWIAADPTRKTLIDLSRTQSADTLAEEADRGIMGAKNLFQLRKAEARAHHLRWLAKMRDPKRFSDRLVNEHTGEGGGPVIITATPLDERL